MILIILIIGLTSGTVGHAQTAAVQEPSKAAAQDWLNRVRGGVMSGSARPADAVRELKAILAVDPRSVEAHLLLGIAYRSLGTPEMVGESIAELRQAIALDPSFVPARFYLAHLYLDLGRAPRAREELEAALAQAPRNPQFLGLLAEVERQLGHPDRAVDLARQSLQADASSPETRYYLGLALFDSGQRREAIAELEQVVQAAPNVVEPFLSLGTAFVDAGRLDDAVRVLQQGVRVDAKRTDVRVQLVRAYRLKGLLEKANEQLELASPQKSMTLTTPVYQQVQSDLYLETGLLRLAQGQLVAAAAALKKVLGMDANSGPAHRGLAEVYLRQGHYPQATEEGALAEKLGAPLTDEQKRQLQAKAPRRNHLEERE